MDLKEVVSGQEVANLLGITYTRFNQLTADGTIPKKGRGQYVVGDAVQAYCNRLREQASGRLGVSGGTDEDGAETFDPVLEGARLKARQADMTELQLAKARGEVIQTSEILEVWGLVIGAARSRIMSLSNRLPTMIHGMTTKEQEIVREECRDILERLVEDGDQVAGTLQDKALSQKV